MSAATLSRAWVRRLGVCALLFAVAAPASVVDAGERPAELFAAPSGDYVVEFPAGQPERVGNEAAGVPEGIAFDMFFQLQGEVAFLSARTVIPGTPSPVDEAIRSALQGIIGVGGEIRSQSPADFRGASGADVEGTFMSQGVQTYFLGRILIRRSVLFMVLVSGVQATSFKDPGAAAFFGSFEFVKGVYR